ncbi:MAG: HAD family phosphatase, partial [Notoacmeibacter sp.]
MIDHIVFDIGKVLIQYDPHLGLQEAIPSKEQRDWFFANICTHDWNIEQDRGRSWIEAEELLIDAYPEHAKNIRAFRQNWHKMVPSAIDGTVAIMRTLIDDG